MVEAVSKVTLKLLFLINFFIEEDILIFLGNRTNLGSGLHHKIGESSEYHGKIAFEYARINLFNDKSPPKARRPSLSAFEGCGNQILSSSL